MRAGLEVMERAVAANPFSSELRNSYGYALHRNGRYPEAIRELESYQRLEPDEPNPLDSLAEVYLIAGQPEKALEKYAAALAMDSSFFSAYLGRSMAFGALGRFDDAFGEVERWRRAQEDAGVSALGIDAMRRALYACVGRFEDAAAAGERARALGEQVDTGFGPTLAGAAAAADHAELAFRRGDYGAATELSMQALASLDSFDGQDRAGMLAVVGEVAGAALARTGKGERALQLAAEIDADPPHPMMARVSGWIRGEVALARGDLDAADEAFRRSPSPGKHFYNGRVPFLWLTLRTQNSPLRDWEARILAAEGDLSGAVAEYAQLNTPGIENADVSLFEPLYVLEAARLKDRMGDPSGAAQDYARFLEYWKDADEGLPEVAEARAYR